MMKYLEMNIKSKTLSCGARCATIWKQIHEKLSQIYSNMQENNNPCHVNYQQNYSR